MRRQTIMRLLVLAIVAVFAVGLIAASPASADCNGPSMTFTPHDVDRGGEVTVTGTGWGDNCYDAGVWPEGEGVLGRPVNDVEIVVIQGDMEWAIATVDADDDYGFVTRVVVPQDAAPGDAQLIARKPGTLPPVFNPDPTLRISTAAAVTSAPTTASTPDPSVAESATASEAETNTQESETATPWFAAAATMVVASAAGAWVVTHRRKQA